MDFSAEKPLQESHRSPLVEMLYLAAPTVLQMSSYTLMQFIDLLLLSHYGDNRQTGLAPTAATNAGLTSFSLLSIGFGALLVVNTLVSQAFGRKDPRACGRYLWQGIYFAFAYALALAPVIPVARMIFQGLHHKSSLVVMETIYLQIMIAGFVLKLTQLAFSQFLLAIDRPMSVLTATLCGVTCNALAAWVLIYGKLGLPAMGIRGSALGQNIGMGVELIILVVLSMRRSVRVAYFMHEAKFHWAEFRLLLTIGLPAGLQLIADAGAWTLFSEWVMAPLGEATMAANTFTFRYYSVSFMPAYGLATAVTALVGRYIGRGEPDIAAQRAALGFKLTAGYMLLCGAVFFFFRHHLLKLFTESPEILGIGAVLLVYAAIYQFFDAMYIVYNGALRGAGDTLWPAITTMVLCWGVTVAGGRWIAVQFPRFGAAGPWFAATMYGVLLGVYMFARFRRGGWKKLRVG